MLKLSNHVPSLMTRLSRRNDGIQNMAIFPHSIADLAFTLSLLVPWKKGLEHSDGLTQTTLQFCITRSDYTFPKLISHLWDHCESVQCADGLLNYTVQAAKSRHIVGKELVKFQSAFAIVGFSLCLIILLFWKDVFKHVFIIGWWMMQERAIFRNLFLPVSTTPRFQRSVN